MDGDFMNRATNILSCFCDDMDCKLHGCRIAREQHLSIDVKGDSQDGRTHYTGCWYAHHDCARDHIEALNAEIGRLQAELKMANDKIVRHCEAFVRVADERDVLRAIADELENANLDGAEDYVRLVSELRRRIQEMRS